MKRRITSVSLSEEYTDWDLTPRGWERGTERLDTGKTTEVKPPLDRVLTVRWLEEQISPSHRHESSNELWRSTDVEAIRELIEYFGTPPRSL
jgi:hypothetical protein